MVETGFKIGDVVRIKEDFLPSGRMASRGPYKIIHIEKDGWLNHLTDVGDIDGYKYTHYELANLDIICEIY